MPVVVLDLVEPGIMVHHQEPLDPVVGVDIDGQGGLDKIKQIFLSQIFGQIRQLRVVLDWLKLTVQFCLLLVQLVNLGPDGLELLLDLGHHLLLIRRDLLWVGHFQRLKHLCVAGVHLV